MSNYSPLNLLVRKLNNHVALDDEDKAALIALPHVVRELSPASYIVREGETPSGCAVLLDGFAFRQKLAADGGRQILSVQIPGDALDMEHLFLDCADHNVQALTRVRIAVIPRAALRTIAMERPTIAHAFAVNNQVEAAITREWLLNVGRRDARTRLAHLLCEVATRLQGQDLVDDYGYELPMTQEQLADATALTNVHVNRTLKSLEDEGLIKRDRRAIRFPNWQALKAAAGFDPLYLHIGQQSAAGLG
jgi:CRP-like cAMP-binding protein